MPRELYKYQSLDIKDYSGGLNSNPLSSQVKDNEATDCQNIIWQDGALRMVPGFRRHTYQIGGTDSTTRINGIVDFTKRDGDQKIVITAGTDILYYESTTSTWDSIKGALTVTDNMHQFVVFNDILIGTNYTDEPWAYTGAGNAAALGGNPPEQAKCVATFNDRVVLGNCVALGTYYPASVFFSAVDDGEDWDVATREWSFDTDDGQVITGVKQLGEKLVVFKDNSIGYVTGFGTESWFVNRQWIKSIGCVSGYSVQTGYITVEGALQQVLIFMSPEGLKGMDESGNIYHLPVPSQGEEYKCYDYFDEFSQTGLRTAVGLFYRKRNWAFMFYPDSGSSYNNEGCIYDYDSNSLWKLKDITVSSAANINNKTTGEIEVWVGTNDGRLMVLSETAQAWEDETELITDGDMEDVGVDEWPLIPAVGGSRAKSVVTYLNGAQGLEITSAGPGIGVYQEITTVVGQTYRVYASVISTAGAAGAWQMTAYDGTTALDTSSLTHSTTNWVVGELEFQATSTTTKIQIEDRRGAGGKMVIDDVSARCTEVDAFWQSKYHDFGNEYASKLLREFVALATVGTVGGLTVEITYDKDDSVVTTDTVSMLAALLDWDDDLDWDEDIDWDSSDEMAMDLSNLTERHFRTIRFKISNNPGFNDFAYNRTLLTIKPLGERFYYGT